MVVANDGFDSIGFVIRTRNRIGQTLEFLRGVPMVAVVVEASVDRVVSVPSEIDEDGIAVLNVSINGVKLGKLDAMRILPPEMDALCMDGIAFRLSRGLTIVEVENVGALSSLVQQKLSGGRFHTTPMNETIAIAENAFALFEGRRMENG